MKDKQNVQVHFSTRALTRRPSPLPPAGATPWHRLAHCSTPAARALVPLSAAEKLPALPLALFCSGEEEHLSAMFAEPLRMDAIKELEFISGRKVIAETIAEDILRRALFLAYRGDTERFSELKKVAEAEVGSNNITRAFTEEALNLAEQASVPQLLRTLLCRALLVKASDLHFEPQPLGMRLRFRVAGQLRQEVQEFLSPQVSQHLTRRIKILAQMDTTENKRPQDGGFTFKDSGWEMRLRVSVIPQLYGEKIVIRILHNHFLDRLASNECSLYALGLSNWQRDLMRLQLAADRGVILLSGPTGSGKSTLLYAALQILNTEQRNIVTLENPIERVLDGINQTEVSTEEGSFAAHLRALVRQDPDVLMLGEIRDFDSAHTALSAGVAGTLVLSSVHAGSCFEVVYRLLELGLRPELIFASLRLISAQRLLRKNCSRCQTSIEATGAVRQVFKLASGEVLQHSPGCEFCRREGVERVGVFEFLPLSEKMRAVLRENALASGKVAMSELQQMAEEVGYTPLAFSVRSALLKGTISPEVALRALGFDANLL